VSVENLIKYARWGNGDDVMDFNCNADDQEYVRIEEAVEAEANKIKKIKSKITSIERRASGFIGTTNAIHILEQVLLELRQLTGETV